VAASTLIVISTFPCMPVTEDQGTRADGFPSLDRDGTADALPKKVREDRRQPGVRTMRRVRWLDGTLLVSGLPEVGSPYTLAWFMEYERLHPHKCGRVGVERWIPRAEITIGPMWAIPMDIASAYSGSASGIMNTGSALAAIISPVVGGYLIQRTASWLLPFIVYVGVILIGSARWFTMRPGRPLAEGAAMTDATAAALE